MKIISNAFIFLTLVSAISCNSNRNKPQFEETNINPNMHKVLVLEVKQANAYTYLRVEENKEEHWLAVSKREAKTGDVFYYEEMLAMQDFASKDLDTTFAEILFINDLMTEPKTEMERLAEKYPEGKKPDLNKMEIKVEAIEGGVTIGELYANKDKYSGKSVKVSGKVVKFSAEIMDKNWIHLQDGTETDGKFDLTVTTLDVVKLGENVVFEGIIAIDKDFGAGYKYELIMEEAKQLTEVNI